MPKSSNFKFGRSPAPIVAKIGLKLAKLLHKHVNGL